MLNIDSLNSSGEGVARRGRDVYFVAGALPGETVEVILDGRRRKVWQTRLLNIVQPTPHRVTPACAHYQRCGGCNLQHLSYAQQVQFKQTRVANELQRQNIQVHNWAQPIIAEPWHYRRKARVGVRFSPKQKDNIVGFREAGSSHLTQIEQCAVLPEHPALNWQDWREQINALQGRAHITQIEVTVADNALALVLRAIKPLSASDERSLQNYIAALPASLPVQLWLKESKEGAARLLYPAQAEPLYHTPAGQPLPLQLDDFLQVNATVNQQMVAQALAWLDVQSQQQVWDLFAGHGNFSVPLATQGAQVLAFEGSAAMVASLNRYAQQQQLAIQAQEMDLTQPQLDVAKPEAILLDPPRAGALELMPLIARQKLAKVLYVSCDAATLARDLAVLIEAGYQVVQAGIMDMFPQTHHVETMVLLEHRKK